MLASLTSFVALALLAAAAPAVDNGYGRTPTLGYNTYNAFACAPDEAKSLDSIAALKKHGLIDAGYKTFQIDCGWQSNQRDPKTGAIAVASDRFPRGLGVVAEAARGQGMDFGMYTDQGLLSCDTDTSRGAIGSLGHEAADVAFFASLNATTVKVDNCFVDGKDNSPKVPRTDFVTRFKAMGDALKANGIKGMTICQWGVPYSSPDSGLQGPAQWTGDISTSYRLSDDIAKGWTSILQISNQAMHIAKRGMSGPGHFADADLLEVGNGGLTAAEEKTHFSLWAMLKSNLMISTQMDKASPDSLALLANKELLAINQDSMGKPIQLIQRFTNDHDVYAGPLPNGDVAVLIVEQGNLAGSMKIDFSLLEIVSADVHDLWSGEKKTKVDSYTAEMDQHGCIALRLSNVRRPSTFSDKIAWHSATSGKGGVRADCSGCSGKSKVGGIDDATVYRLENITAARAKSTLLFDYINAEVQFSFQGETNERGALIRVNGGEEQSVSFPLSGYNWDTDVWKNYRVDLTGFVVGGGNYIEIRGGSTLSQYAPDLDRIGIIV